MVTNKPKRKRDSTSPRVLYCPGFAMHEMKFRDDEKAIKAERKAWLKYATAKAAAQKKLIEADEARELADRILRANQIIAQDKLNLAAEELEKKMQAAELADREEARRVFGRYIEQVAAKFKAAVEDEGKWREQVNQRLQKITADENRSLVRAERLKLLERGSLRGRR
jgi:hypothetical protein